MARTRGALVAVCLLALAWTCASPGPGVLPTAVPAPPAAADLGLPNRPGSLKFAVIGDNGTGGRPQYEVAARMAAWHQRFPFTLVLMLGDNIYGSESPADMVRKFESPYKALLDAGVTFHASLGNHDSLPQRTYAPFNMGGRRYYSFAPTGQSVRFFALHSGNMDPEQRAWLERELSAAKETWKIAFFHHPLYSSAHTHGSDVELRRVLEPLFVKYGVSVVLSGHDHVYERIRPQHGIAYFVEGAAGQLRAGDLHGGTAITAKGFDTDRSFLLMEISGDDLAFAAVSRRGEVVDSGVLHAVGASPER